MARRVSRRRKKKTPETELTLDDYQFQGEKRIYLEAVGGLAGIILFLAWDVLFFMVGPPLNNNIQPDAPLYGKWWVPVIMVVYPALTWVVANWLALRPRRSRLKEAGMSARVLNKTHPKLKGILAEQCRLLGMDEPEMYVLDDETPYMYSMPGRTGVIVTGEPVLGAMNDDEMAVLIARELGHIKSRHARMALVVQFMRLANPVVKVLLFPITALALFLRGWMNLIEVTADRVAILVTGRPALVNAALVKFAVAVDQESGITREELDAYLQTGTDVASDSAGIERHFKVGAFLSEQSNLRDRIEEVGDFLESGQGQAALEKVVEIKRKLT